MVIATADATVKCQCPMKCEGDIAYITADYFQIREMALKSNLMKNLESCNY